MIRPSHWGLRLAASALTLGVVLQPTAGHAAAPAPAIQMPHISVIASGEGSAVILIPGLSSPRAVWDGVVPVLAKSHRVHVVQVNGFGDDAPGANLSPGVLDGIVADLHALIGREKIAGAAVVGHSMGGLAAPMLAKAHPADDAMATATANQLASKPASRAKVVSWVKAADPRVSAQAMYEDMTTDLRAAMKDIATPITLVYPWNATGPTKAAADALYKPAYADAPHVTFVDIGDAAHFVMLDQPAAFEAALTAFLAK